MSYITDEEIDTIRVTRMILFGRADQPLEPQPEIDVQQVAFFRARILSERSCVARGLRRDSERRCRPSHT